MQIINPYMKNLIDIIFDRENVFNLATSKSSNVYKSLDKDKLTGLYRSALKTIGFISEDLDMNVRYYMVILVSF